MGKNYEQAIRANTAVQRWKLWEDALKLKGSSLRETFIAENMLYLGWPRKKVISCWGEAGTEKIKEKWIKESPKSKKEIENYYNNLDLYIPELSSWHAMEKNEDLLRIVQFMQFCIRCGTKTYLDFGAGIGSSGLLFDHYGLSTTLADISDAMLNYSNWRFKKRCVNAKFIDLK